MKAPENLNALDRAHPARVARRSSSPRRRSRAASSSVWDDYVYLVDVKAGQRAPRVRQRAPPRATCTRLEQAQAENRELRRLLQLARLDAGRRRERAGRRQGLHRVLPRHARRARPRLARRAAAHAGHLARRRRRRRSCTSPATRSTCSSRSTPRSASTSRTSAPTRAASCAAPATRRATRARSRWSTRATRSRSAISSSRAARASGSRAASRSRASRRSIKRELGRDQDVEADADRRLLAPRRRAHPRRRRPATTTSRVDSPTRARRKKPTRASARRRSPMRNTAFLVAGLVAARSLAVRTSFASLSPATVLRTCARGLVPSLAACRSSSSWACTSTRSRAARRSRSCSATRPTSSGIAPVGLYTFTYVAPFVLARAAGVAPRRADDADAGRARARLHARPERDGPRPPRDLRARRRTCRARSIRSRCRT